MWVPEELFFYKTVLSLVYINMIHVVAANKGSWFHAIHLQY